MRMATQEARSVRIHGQVVERGSGRLLSHLRVEAWDKDLIFDDLVGSAVTDAQGRFHIDVLPVHYAELCLDRRPDVYFKVFRAGRVIEAAAGLWNATAGDRDVLIELPGDGAEPDGEETGPPGGGEEPWLRADSLDDLLREESRVLARIASTRNGGNLFLANPFLLLSDVGVALSERARREILRLVPELSTASPAAYQALKASREPQSIVIRLHGLFPRNEGTGES